MILGPTLKKLIENGEDPFTWAISLVGDTSNHTNNSELNLTVVSHSTGTAPSPAENGPVSIFYSVALFLELFNEYAPAEVCFSKAIGRNATGTDIIFKLTKSGETVFCGDNSQAWP